MTQPPLAFRMLAALRIGWRFHGLALPWILVRRTGSLLYQKLFQHSTFQLGGQSYPYTVHHFALNNERTVEVSVARKFMESQTGEILELGNVLSNYCSFAHDVVDKYELTPGVINQDIVSYEPGKKYKAIVTLSTLEHVGWDEEPREPQKILAALAKLKDLLAEGGRMLLTVPIGYNAYLDELIDQERLGMTQTKYMVRVSSANEWQEADLKTAIACKFGAPFPFANAIVIGYFEKQTSASSPSA